MPQAPRYARKEWGQDATAEMAAAPVACRYGPTPQMAPAASEPPGGVLICSKRRCLWAVRPNPGAERQELSDRTRVRPSKVERSSSA